MLRFDDNTLLSMDENNLILMQILLHEGFKAIAGKTCDKQISCKTCPMLEICDIKDALDNQLSRALQIVTPATFQ